MTVRQAEASSASAITVLTSPPQRGGLGCFRLGSNSSRPSDGGVWNGGAVSAVARQSLSPVRSATPTSPPQLVRSVILMDCTVLIAYHWETIPK